MFNRHIREDQEQCLEARRASTTGGAAGRDASLRRYRARTLKKSQMSATFHGRVEGWMNSQSVSLDGGERPQSPSYQTKKLAAHHRFRDRNKELEIGPMRVSSQHYVNERDRITRNLLATQEALLHEEYQQPNPLPSHAKYAARMRRKEREIHGRGGSMRYTANCSQPERILDTTLRNRELQTHGQYDKAAHASKFSGPHSPRLGESMAPHWRSHQPKKWQGLPMVLQFHEGDVHPHDFLNKEHARDEWIGYNGRIGSLTRVRRAAQEVDQTRVFQNTVAFSSRGERVSGPDHRTWAAVAHDNHRPVNTLRPHDTAQTSDFSVGGSAPETRMHYKTIGHYAHAYKGPADGGDVLANLNSSFGAHPSRNATAQKVLSGQVAN